jgi:hypothetical protein
VTAGRGAATQSWPSGYEPEADHEIARVERVSGPAAPCGTYTHLTWPAPRGRRAGFDGFEDFEWELTPELDTSQGYFWAHQFALRASHPASGGYAGLQANGTYPGGPAKVAIFSIWHALDAEGDGVAQPFGGEGEGYQTLVRYPWVAGRTYRLRVEVLDDGWWRATVGDGETEVEIGRIRVPSSWGRLDTWSVVWTELFSPPIRQCDEMECASAVWSGFTADGGAVRPVALDSRLGTPARCANSRIAVLASGAIRHQMGLPAPRRSGRP